MNNGVLSDFASFVTARIDVAKLSPQNYVGVDNLLPNRSGRVDSEYVPNEGSATAFIVGDVLIGNIRPYFKKIWLSDRNGGCSNDVLVIRSKGIIKPSFLYALLSTDQFFDYNMSGSKGTKMPRGDKEHIMRYPAMVPEYQEEIGTFLQAINEKILLSKSICADLDALAKTLYDYWFGQFDFPDENGKPYRTSGGAMEWNEQLKREIPKGWKVDTLPKHCNIVDCLHSTKPVMNFEAEDYYLLQLENLVDHGLINLEDKFYVTEEMYKLWTSRIEVIEGDLVITNAGRVGSVARIPHYVKTGIGRNMTAIRPKSIPPCFLYYFFTSRDMDRQIKANTDTGSFFGSLNVRGIKELLLALPPKNQQTILDNFEYHVLPVRRKIEVCAQEIFELTRLRDWLLPMLMNGQATVE